MTNSDRLNASELEDRVRERTAELEKANEELRAEILERKRVEDELIKLKEKLEVEVRDTSILHSLSTRYIEGSDSLSIFYEIVEAAIAITGADKGNMQIFDTSTKKLKIVAQKGFSLPFLNFFESVDAGDKTACGTAMQRMDRVVVEDITQNSTFLGRDALNILLNEEVRAVQSTPLISRSGQFLGVLSTHFSQVHTPAERELTLIDVLARQAADITERKQAEEVLCQAYEEIRAKSLALQVSKGKLQARSEELRVQTKELQEAHKVLIEGEKRYHLLFDHSMDAIFLTDPSGSGKILSANPAACRMLGWSEEELIGKGCDVIFDPEDPVLSTLLDERSCSGSARAQLTCKRKDETTFIGELSTALFIDSNGEPRAVAIIRDITERKQAEEALRKSEERYRMLFTNMTEAFFVAEIICDKNGKPYDYRFLEVNPAYELNMGVKKEQILGKTVLEVFSRINPIAIEKSGEVALSGKPMHFEVVSHTANKCFEAYAFSHEKGKFAIIFRDITRRKETEAKLKKILNNLDKLVKERTAELEGAYNSLKESEERYRIVVERTGQLVYDYNLRADRGSWTGAIEEITGYTAEEFQKFDRSIWIENIHPDDREHIVKYIREARMTGKTFREELRFRKKNGSYIFIEDSGAFLLDEKGIPYRSLGVIKDITERKLSQQRLQQSEEKYRSFIENFKGIAFRLDKDFNLEFIHGAVKEITGYSEEELISNGWIQAILPEDLCLLFEGEKKAQLLGDNHGELDYRIKLKDGTIKWVHDIHQRVMYEDGKTEAYTGIIYDITEKKEAEEALSRIKEARIKEIHHRIKNNLQVISSLLSLEAERFSDEKTLQAFKESQNRIVSMALIHEELFKSRGADELDFAAYIHKLTKELFKSYNLRNEDIILKLDLAQAYLGMDTAIPLGIIVNELISNSLKHAFPDGKIWEISIHLKKIKHFDINRENPVTNHICKEKSNYHYILIVADNGKGIPEEIDFQNTDSLGLQLVNALVEQIEGCIELRRGQGSEFIICFNNLEK